MFSILASHIAEHLKDGFSATPHESHEWHTDYYTTSDSLPKHQSSLLLCLAWIIPFPSLATKAPQRAFHPGSPVYGLLYFCVYQLLPSLSQSHVYYKLKYCSKPPVYGLQNYSSFLLPIEILFFKTLFYLNYPVPLISKCFAGGD